MEERDKQISASAKSSAFAIALITTVLLNVRGIPMFLFFPGGLLYMLGAPEDAALVLPIVLCGWAVYAVLLVRLFFCRSKIAFYIFFRNSMLSAPVKYQRMQRSHTS